MFSLLCHCRRNTHFLNLSSLYALCRASLDYSSQAVSSVSVPCGTRTPVNCPEKQCLSSTGQSDFDILVSRILVGSSHGEVFQSLSRDGSCDKIQLSHAIVDKLLLRFKNDWISALGFFRWAESRSGYKHTSEAYDTMVDILGKMKQMDQMRALLEEMRGGGLVTIHTVSKVMRRFAGAGQWEGAVRIFDELGCFGLEKNTETMNLLLDTLCKEGMVVKARAIFLELKSHIPPNASTFNIFVHGWCKANRVDEAHWTIQEMKGHGCSPCVISYSTIIQFHCCQNDFDKVYELFDEMEAEGCPPNVVTYTIVMSSLAKSEQFEEALQVAQRMRSNRCKPDTRFYNSLLHSLGRAGRQKEAIKVFEVEMLNGDVPPNTSTYNTMIAMFCRQNQEQKALNLLRDMRASMICKPDVQTYYPLLKACFRTGKIDLLVQLLDDMVTKHNLSLDDSAYTLLIHRLCRANKCEWAFSLFEEMIGKGITPRYRTCLLLLEETKQKNMYNASEKIEVFVKTLQQ